MHGPPRKYTRPGFLSSLVFSLFIVISLENTLAKQLYVLINQDQITEYSLFVSP